MESGSFVLLGFKPDFAAVGFNNVFSDKHSQTGPFSFYFHHIFAAEEFAKNSLLLVFGDADAVVLNSKFHILFISC